MHPESKGMAFPLILSMTFAAALCPCTKSFDKTEYNNTVRVIVAHNEEKNVVPLRKRKFWRLTWSLVL